MKLFFVTGLVFIKLTSFNYCCKIERLTASEERIQKKYDPSKNLLSHSEIAIIKSVPVDKQDYLANSFQRKRILERQTIFHNFECAGLIAKNLLEYYRKPFQNDDAFQGLYMVALHGDENCSHAVMPESDVRKIKQLGEQDPKNTDLNKEMATFRRWYCFLFRNLHPMSMRINSNLQIYYQNNPDSCCNNMTALRVKFCASVARSARVFNYIRDTFLPIFQTSKYVPDGDGTDDEFTRYLFSKWPSYTFNYEDVTFLNILLGCQSPKKIDEGNFLRYIEVQNFNRDNELVAIPLSDKCLKQKFMSTKFYSAFLNETASLAEQ